MNTYRITKYNPKLRDENGYYKIDEWTDFSDVGEKFNDIKLTIEEYFKVESAYITVAISILKKCNINSLTVKGLEKRCRKQKIYENQVLPIKNIEIVFKNILRNKVWCRLECENTFIHIGFDYYMYIGCNLSKQEVENISTKNNLFCEEVNSPYNEGIFLLADKPKD